MDNFPSTPEVIGIGFVAVASFWILWKLFSRVLDVMQQNTDSQERLARNIENNTRLTLESKETMTGVKNAMEKQTQFMELLIKSQIKKK